MDVEYTYASGPFIKNVISIIYPQPRFSLASQNLRSSLVVINPLIVADFVIDPGLRGGLHRGLHGDLRRLVEACGGFLRLALRLVEACRGLRRLAEAF